MKYNGNFTNEESEKLKEYKYRLDIFFAEDKKEMQTHLFRTYESMICFIAKIDFEFEDIYMLEKFDFTTYRPMYNIKYRINWYDYE